MAARLHDAPDKLAQLPLARPVPASLARGVELGARFALERSQNGQTWVNYLNAVSTGGSHASWRRWSLLAILRSELVFTLLNRASVLLFENDGTLLRELIRTAIAVESRPLVETLAANGFDVASIYGVDVGPFANIYGPSNRSWERLVRWLLARRAHLPLRALPDIVELFQSLSTCMPFDAPLEQKMTVALAEWLEEIEEAQDDRSYGTDRPRFARAFRSHDLQDLAGDVRRTFFSTAASVPERAQSYLRRLMERPRSEYVIQELMHFRGSLALAAPAELVDLTLAGLVPKNEGGRRIRRLPNDVFTHLDTEFLPSSPAKGPFLDLLNAAPEHGLRLIRRLVNHAITTLTHGRQPGDDGFMLRFPSGPRFFPWQRSYLWSRHADGCYSIESGLLALEAWAHARIERGDAPEQVIADILGPEGSPAAFLLVAVDVLISHWPKTMATAIPFLGSPELLSLDRTRHIHDGIPEPDLLGWGAIRSKEPVGLITLADLKGRPSRRHPLEALLGNFAVDASADRGALHALLVEASARLGPHEPDDTFAEPRFMAYSALNLIDPANWHAVDGGQAYVSPPEEEQHIEALQRRGASQALDFGIDAAIQNALECPERSSANLAELAVAYAERLLTEADTPDEAAWSQVNAIVSAMVILARDGADVLLDQHENWAREVFAHAFASRGDMSASRLHDSIHFNRVAIATLGLIHLWRRHRRDADRDALLGLVGRDDPCAAQGFGAGLAVIREIEPRLLPALLRCALTAQIHPLDDWDDPEEKKAASQAQYRERVSAAITAERAWLDGGGPEPSWPALPPWMVSVRGPGGGLVRAEQPDHRFVLQSAALWTRQLTRDSNPGNLDWIVKFVEAYADWTAAANGAGLEPDAELDGDTDEWNSIFFLLLARAFARLTPDQAAAYVAGLVAVPDESFLDIASELVPAIDRGFFDGLGLDLDQALRLRALVADRLVQCAGWERESNRSGLSIERRIAPAIGVLFFNLYNTLTGASSCYLTANGIDRVDPFLPKLTQLMDDGPVPFCGLLTLNLVEVSPRPAHLTFVLSSALTWLRRQPTNTLLWVDTGLGARVTKWLKSMFEADAALRNPSHPLRPQIDDVLARLVQLGVAEAHSVEALLATRTDVRSIALHHGDRDQANLST